MSFKIIHLVLGKANPNRMNGVNKVAHNHAMSLHAIGCDVEIWGITKSPHAPTIERPFPTRLFKQQPFFRDLDPKLLYALSKLPSKTVFHIHGGFIPDFYKMTRMLIDMKVAYIYTPHGAFNEIALEKNKWIKKFYIQRYEKAMLKDAKKVHFLGQSEYDHINSIAKLNNKIIIPNGQDFKDINFEFHKITRHVHPVFGFCGRMDIYYKGLDLLINAFAKYKDNGGKGELWLIGDGPERHKLESIASDKKIKDSVHFIGAKFGKDKLNRIANMDVFCHTSRSEGSPTAVLEAAALEKPLLVSTGTNVGHLVDLRECGIHIKQNNVESIAQAFHNFEKHYNNGALTKMGEQASKMVEEEFNWTNIAKQLLSVYKESVTVKR